MRLTIVSNANLADAGSPLDFLKDREIVCSQANDKDALSMSVPAWTFSDGDREPTLSVDETR